MYTLFMRIIEVLEQTKQRLKNKEVGAKIDQEKKALAVQYNHQLLNNQYHLLQLTHLTRGNANKRIQN